MTERRRELTEGREAARAYSLPSLPSFSNIWKTESFTNISAFANICWASTSSRSSNFLWWTDFWWKWCKNFCTILPVWDLNRWILKCWSHINDVALVSMPVTPRPRGVTVLSLQPVHLSVRLSRPSLWLWYPKIALRGFPSNSAQMVTAIQGWTDPILEVVRFNLTFLFLWHHFLLFY